MHLAYPIHERLGSLEKIYISFLTKCYNTAYIRNVLISRNPAASSSIEITEIYLGFARFLYNSVFM